MTYAQLFSVLPFGNELIVKSLTSDALVQVLEEQFGAERSRIMRRRLFLAPLTRASGSAEPHP